MKKLSHTDGGGKAVMVDVGDKIVQTRIARAEGYITISRETMDLLKENQLKKGDVFTVAQLAGINAAKMTSALIPLCHNIFIENVKVGLSADEMGVRVESEVRSTGKTGVEMEALTAVSVALLTVYDMCKAVDKNMIIGRISLIEKIKK